MIDPYPSGRIITREMAKEYEGPSAIALGSKLSAYLRDRAAEGLNSGLWCPVLYYRYAVGLVFMANGPERKRALDFAAVDLAYEFSRILAWFLKRHGYFAGSSKDTSSKRGSIIDASPAGLLAALPNGGPRIERGSIIRLRLALKSKTIVCSGKVAAAIRGGRHELLRNRLHGPLRPGYGRAFAPALRRGTTSPSAACGPGGA